MGFVRVQPIRLTHQDVSDRANDHTHCQDEEAYIAKARQGDPAAIDWIINRYRVRVVRLAMSILRHSGEAEDAAQEAFVRAFRNLSDYRSDGKFYTWLYRIVVRECLDRKRLSRWQAEVQLDEGVCSQESHANCYEETELRVVVEALLDQMTPPMRAMIVLRELEGLEYAEIAAVLQIPIGRVRWRLHEARQKFKVLWERSHKEKNHE